MRIPGLKIRFYHWWIYRLYRWTWNPILRLRPEMVRMMAQALNAHVIAHEEWVKDLAAWKMEEK